MPVVVDSGSIVRRAAGFALAWAVFGAGPSHAQVLDIRPDNSIVTYSGPAIYSDTGVQSLLPAPAAVLASRPGIAPPDVATAIRASSERHGVNHALLEAVAWQESHFRQDAVSPKGARGVMQLMPATARTLGADAADLTANVDAGAAYLARMLRQFNGDPSLALAAYNAGPDAVSRFGGVPPYAETRAYVRSILQNLARARLTAVGAK